MQETFHDADNKQLLLLLFFFFFQGIDTSDGGSVMSDCETTWIKKLNEEGFFTFVH